MTEGVKLRALTMVGLLTAVLMALAMVAAAPAHAQLDELAEQCPEEFPLCPEGDEAPDDPDDAPPPPPPPPPPADDDQVGTFPEGGVGTGAGGAASTGSPGLAALLGLGGVAAATAGVAVRRRFGSS